MSRGPSRWQRMILAQLAVAPATVIGLAIKTGMTRSSVQRALWSLMRRGIVDRRRIPSLMPSKSTAQHDLMAAAANNPDVAKSSGIPKGVAKDFVEADRDRNFAKVGGMSQASEGGHRGRHTTQMTGHKTHAAYSLGKRRAK